MCGPLLPHMELHVGGNEESNGTECEKSKSPMDMIVWALSITGFRAPVGGYLGFNLDVTIWS